MRQSQDRSQSFHFQLVKPSGKLSTFVQGIWTASVARSESEPMIKPLYPDAGSGLIFNLGGSITIDENTFSTGIIALPVSKKSRLISLPPAALISGIRFHPAIAYGVFGKHYEEPTLINADELAAWGLHDLFNTLGHTEGAELSISTIMSWAEAHVDYLDVLPKPIEKAFQSMDSIEKIEHLHESVHVSQRHIERLFVTWLDMTPKHFQRVLRTHKAIRFLRDHPQADLAEVAANFGFSDQAHMTREFSHIASITPRKVR